ncbi:uncharacterized protein LOC118410561 [Branchiostoma floridae]|uniref:Uncharacterized protein LOC118410561 n=1 Tax=Branchiostoma floridae TaxID=7739 RepID=A0A9J7KQD5_BRAFL|nr:uncharacterized protein LOC118410561 [Branchiostoma floridae]
MGFKRGTMLLLPKILAVVVLCLDVQGTAGQFCSLRGCCSGEDDSCSTPDGNGGVCYCDHFCLLTGDCCPDYAAICDEDECATEPSVCHVNATCHNTVGSYECVCKEGFVGNGEHCVDETLGPCATHTSINEPRRSSAFVPGPTDALICDNVLPAGWYRFVTDDSGGKMPETCVEQFHCGTQVPVWLNGAHPTDYQAVDREGCMNYGVPGDCCTLTVQIQVQRCPASNGNPDFFVYNLQPTFACDIVYCADPTPVDNTTTALPTRRIPRQTVGSSRSTSEPSVTRTMTIGSATQRTAAMAARTSATPTDSGGAPVSTLIGHSTTKSTSTKLEENIRTAGESTTPMNLRTRTSTPRTVSRSGSAQSVTRTATIDNATPSHGTAAVAAKTSATPTDSGGTPINSHNTAKSTSMKPEENGRAAGESTTLIGRRTWTGAPDEQQPTAPTSRRTATGDGVTDSPGAMSSKGVIIGATCAGLIFVLVTSIIICVLCRKRKPSQNTEKVTPSGDDAVALGNLRNTDGNVYDVIVDTKGSEDPPHEYLALSSFSSPLKLAGSVNIGGGLKDQQGTNKSPPSDDHTYQSLGPTEPEYNHEYQSLTPLGHDYENLGFMSE